MLRFICRDASYAPPGIIIQMAGTRVTFAAIILTALAVLLPSVFGFVGERRLKRQLKAAEAASEREALADQEATGGRLSTQHQRNLKLSQQNLESNSAALNPIRESDSSRQSDTQLSIASTVVFSSQQQLVQQAHASTYSSAADQDQDSETCSGDKNPEGGEWEGERRVSTAESVNTSAKVRVEMSDEIREKMFISTDLTLYNTHRTIFWLVRRR